MVLGLVAVGGTLLHTHMQNNISRNEQHRNIFKLWFLDAAAEDFSGKTAAGLAAEPSVSEEIFSKFFNGSAQNKAEIFCVF